MSGYNLKQSMDKVTSQMAGVAAQFQIALDRLAETDRGAFEKIDVMNQDVKKPKDNTEDDNSHEFITDKKTAPEIADEDIGNKTNNHEASATANSAEHKKRFITPHSFRRPPGSNVAIIKITAEKPRHVSAAQAHCSSKVIIHCHSEAREDTDRNGGVNQYSDSPSKYQHLGKIHQGVRDKSKSQAKNQHLDWFVGRDDICELYAGLKQNSNIEDNAEIIETFEGYTCSLVEKDSPRAGKITKVSCIHANDCPGSQVLPLNTFIKRSKSAVVKGKSELEQHCKSLEGELDGVKSEIVRIISEKQGFFKENGVLKNFKRAYEEIKEENLKLKNEIQKLSEENKFLKSPNSSRNNIELDFLDRSSPDGQEIGAEPSQSSCQENDNVGIMQNGNKEEENQKQIRLLEESLDLIRFEFEEMEKYWKNKLDDERKLKNHEDLDDIIKKSHQKEITKESIKSCQQCSNCGVILESPSLGRRGSNSHQEMTFNQKKLPVLHDDIAKCVIKEIVKLHALKSMIQEECDFLLVKKGYMMKTN